MRIILRLPATRRVGFAGKVLEMARNAAVTDFFPVSTRVNYSKNEGPELLEPCPNPA